MNLLFSLGVLAPSNPNQLTTGPIPEHLYERDGCSGMGGVNVDFGFHGAKTPESTHNITNTVIFVGDLMDRGSFLRKISFIKKTPN